MKETTSLIPDGAPVAVAVLGHNNPPSDTEEDLFQALCKIGMDADKAREFAQWPEALKQWVDYGRDAVKSADGNPDAIPKFITDLKDVVKRGGKVRMDMNEPFAEQIAIINSIFKDPITALTNQISELQAAAGRETQRKVDAAAKARRAEQDRIQAQAAAEEEKARRLTAEKAPEAEEAQITARETRSKSNAIFAAPPPVVSEVLISDDGSKTFVKGNKVIDAEIVDATLIPNHLMIPSIAKIKAAGNRGEKVPGVNFVYGTTTTTRRSKS